MLAKLADYADTKSGLAWPSIGTLADDLEMSPRAVRYALKKLIDLGHISKAGKQTYAQGNWAVKYLVHPLSSQIQGRQNMPTLKSQGRQKTTIQGRQNMPTKNVIKGNNTYPPHSTTQNEPFFDESFVEDWKDCISDPPPSQPPPSTPNHPTSNTYTFDPDSQSLPFLPPQFDNQPSLLLQSLPVRFYRTVDKTTP